MKILKKVASPELILVSLAVYFTFRELGTFPAAWEDDSIFMLTARMLADGKGYALPILEQLWHYPYVLGIGPTVILPSSIFIKLFGFSVTIARIPAALYLLGSFFLMYSFTRRYIGRASAWFATALMITLSALVNTGKIVMGEVPGLFFLFAGILTWQKAMVSKKWSVITGLLLGLSVMSKITLGIIFPALGLCIALALFKKQWNDLRKLIIISTSAVGIFVLWKCLEYTSDPSGLSLILNRTGGGDAPPLRLLTENPQHLLRMPFLYLSGMCVLGTTGIWTQRKNLPQYLPTLLLTTILLCVFYFLSNEGWYRHILPAHILLLPFVYSGAVRLVRTKAAAGMLLLCILAQGWWQLTYHGSTGGTEAETAAKVLHEQYADTKLIIRHSEIFVRYPHNPNWYFLPLPEIASYSPERLTSPSDVTKCLPEVWKVPGGQQAEYGDKLTIIHKRFVILQPDVDCS